MAYTKTNGVRTTTRMHHGNYKKKSPIVTNHKKNHNYKRNKTKQKVKQNPK